MLPKLIMPHLFAYYNFFLKQITLLELSFNSIGDLVGSWLFCKQNFFHLASFQYMCGRVGVGAQKESLALNELI